MGRAAVSSQRGLVLKGMGKAAGLAVFGIVAVRIDWFFAVWDGGGVEEDDSSLMRFRGGPGLLPSDRTHIEPYSISKVQHTNE